MWVSQFQIPGYGSNQTHPRPLKCYLLKAATGPFMAPLKRPLPRLNVFMTPDIIVPHHAMNVQPQRDLLIPSSHRARPSANAAAPISPFSRSPYVALLKLFSRAPRRELHEMHSIRLRTKYTRSYCASRRIPFVSHVMKFKFVLCPSYL